MHNFIASIFILTTGVGDVADYEKKSNCTSNFIRSINASVEVKEDIGDSYLLKVKYRVRSNVGNKSDVEEKAVSKEYFTKEFLDELEENGTHEGDGFSLRHDGRSGKCHLVHVYNIDGSRGATADTTICWGLPVLGLKLLKSKGKIGGVRYKACVKLK